jgi:AcrR family transcriptional regulator
VARISKDPETRRAELMDAAEQLFNEQGFNRTSVDDIVQRVGVAKGLFYYYFKSKDELVKAMVDRMWEKAERDLMAIVEDPGLTALEKFERYARANQERKRTKTHYIDVLEGERNVALVHWMEEEGIRRTAPLLTAIVEQGVREGVFDTEYPQEAVEFVMRGAMMLLTGDLEDEHVAMRRLLAYLEFWERVLGAGPGTLAERSFPGGKDLFERLVRRVAAERRARDAGAAQGGR